VIAMLAEIFMVRLEAERRFLVQRALPSTFIPFNPNSNLAFKETDSKGAEASRKDRPVTEVR
jgi:hypothetical protein